MSAGGSFGIGFDFTVGSSQNGSPVYGIQSSVFSKASEYEKFIDLVDNTTPELHAELTYTYIITYNRLPPEIQYLVDRVYSEQNDLLNNNLVS